MKRILVLSNGAGEDAIASKVLQRLPGEVKGQVVCCPLVGDGHAYGDKFEICGPRVRPPSEGLFRESWLLALKDLAGGVIGGHLRQLKFLRRNRQGIGLTVAVGDLFPVLWAGLSGCGPVLFIGTAKSVFHHPYSLVERLILKYFVSKSVVRDEPTAQELRRQGLRAEWLGNAMMDEVQPRGLDLPFSLEAPVLTLFPGSRAQASATLDYQLRVLELVFATHPQLEVGVAIAPGTKVSDLVHHSQESGWALEAGQGDYHRGVLVKGDMRVHLLAGVLGDLLSRSVLAFGQAGTANEQAAGAGVPVVAYDPKGDKGLRWYRARQKGLLGDAVSVVFQQEAVIAGELQMLLDNVEERERRAAVGRERMGPAGGCERMASAIASEYSGE